MKLIGFLSLVLTAILLGSISGQLSNLGSKLTGIGDQNVCQTACSAIKGKSFAVSSPDKVIQEYMPEKIADQRIAATLHQIFKPMLGIENTDIYVQTAMSQLKLDLKKLIQEANLQFQNNYNEMDKLRQEYSFKFSVLENDTQKEVSKFKNNLVGTQDKLKVVTKANKDMEALVSNLKGQIKGYEKEIKNADKKCDAKYSKMNKEMDRLTLNDISFQVSKIYYGSSNQYTKPSQFADEVYKIIKPHITPQPQEKLALQKEIQDITRNVTDKVEDVYDQIIKEISSVQKLGVNIFDRFTQDQGCCRQLPSFGDIQKNVEGLYQDISNYMKQNLSKAQKEDLSLRIEAVESELNNLKNYAEKEPSLKKQFDQISSKVLTLVKQAQLSLNGLYEQAENQAGKVRDSVDSNLKRSPIKG